MSRTLRILTASLAVVLGGIIFTTTLVHAVWYAPEQTHSLPSVQAQQRPVVAKEAPARLIIPALGINANVQQVGVNATGAMGVPSNFTDVAWYRDGTTPGQLGSAVIDGHVDNGLGLDGVFKHLADIKIGDDVYVQTKAGTKLHFVVSDIESYPYHDVPTDKIFNPTDAQRLNLITCEGAWVSGGRTYDHRLVVYTTLVS
jgi:sortase (surface protein transpeptidase)